MALITRDELETLARRYVWWQIPATTLESPDVLLRQILNLGTADDYLTTREYWGEEAFKRALITAPPGAIDERSWVFRHRQYRLPLRRLASRSFE